MRDIKFRAWDKRKKLMYYPKDNYFTLHIYEDGNVGAWIEIGTEEYGLQLMQYTGLKDKDGKEIYEGDIVIWKELIPSTNDLQRKIQGADCVQLDFIGQIIWDEEGASFDIVNGKYHRGFMTRGDYSVERIGNIYENPELLEKEHE